MPPWRGKTPREELCPPNMGLFIPTLPEPRGTWGISCPQNPTAGKGTTSLDPFWCWGFSTEPTLPVLRGETEPLSQFLTLSTSQFGDATRSWGLGAGGTPQVKSTAPLGTLVAFGGTERPHHISLGNPFGITVIPGLQTPISSVLGGIKGL